MHPKYRCVDHGGAPFFTIAQLEQEPEATDHLGLVGLKWVAACQREAADEGNASGLEDYGLGKPCALAIALEKATDANTLGMIEENRNGFRRRAQSRRRNVPASTLQD